MTTHNDCERLRAKIAAYVMGELGAMDAESLRRHLETCEKCRALHAALTDEEESIRSAFDTLALRSARLEEGLAQRTGQGERTAKRKAPVSKSRSPKGNRKMKNLTRIAAGVLIVACLAGVVMLLTRGGGSVAFADVARPLLTARTATYTILLEMEGMPAQKVDCMFAAPGLHRTSVSDQGFVQVMDAERGVNLTLMSQQKRAILMKMENLPEDNQQAGFLQVRALVEKAQEEGSQAVTYLGEKDIDGRTAVGYLIRNPLADMTVWADAESLLPIIAELAADEKKIMGAPMKMTMSDFEFDVELDMSLFSLEVPDDYKLQEVQVDASKPEEDDLVAMLRLFAETTGGEFPEKFTIVGVNGEFFPAYMSRQGLSGQEALEDPEEMSAFMDASLTVTNGITFAYSLPEECDWRYLGKGVTLGDSLVPVFWYRPKDSATYRVIYGDLRVADVIPEHLPTIPEPVEETDETVIHVEPLP